MSSDQAPVGPLMSEHSRASSELGTGRGQGQVRQPERVQTNMDGGSPGAAARATEEKQFSI